MHHVGILKVVADPHEENDDHVYAYIDSRSITHVVKFLEGTSDVGETVLQLFTISHLS